MKKKDLSIQRLKNTQFPKLYEEFLLNIKTDFDYSKIISCAVLFINSDNIYIQKFGYSIIVEYCTRTQNYEPLYEVAMNLGLYPIAKYINNCISNNNDSFFVELNDSFMEGYHEKGIYHSYEQKLLVDFFNEHINSSLSVVAPTSYGKTQLILSLLSKIGDKNICILTPTKSLLAQTKQRILKANLDNIKKIITHPEMYNNDTQIVAVLTQERLLRLLKKSESIKFDYIVIDEAHNLLKKGSREILLASVLILLEKRNPDIVVKMLTPFLKDSNNLNVRFSNMTFKEFYVNEFIKSEQIYIYDSKKNNGQLSRYDPFLNSFFVTRKNIFADDCSFVTENSSDKNIIYLNKPSSIENFAIRLASLKSDIDNDELSRAIGDISEYIHPQYNLIKFLKKGIVYHHGSVPDAIRLYIERLYTEIPDLRYVVTNSTLLEGVNLPANRMFLLDNKKGLGGLSSSDLKNLIGRVCRFSDIFTSNGSLNKLCPHIYLVNSEYYSKNANLENFLSSKLKVDKEIKDKPENVLLQSTNITDDNKEKYQVAVEFIENYEQETIKDVTNIRCCKTEIGRICFSNNISEIPILDVEEDLDRQILEIHSQSKKICNVEEILPTISRVFFHFIDEKEDNNGLQNIIRLKYEETQSFYTRFLKWRIKGATYNEMINYFLQYWNWLIDNKVDTYVYAGKWGDTTRGGYQELWTNIKVKDITQRINLAIVRIKEEQDFLDNTLIKYIEVLNDLDIIDEPLYLKIKYGTTDNRIITLIRNGLSLTLSKLIVEKYIKYISLDINTDTVEIYPSIKNEMFKNDENRVLINEVSYYIHQ